MSKNELEEKVTLIGSKLSNLGQEFIYKGKTEECEECDLESSCLNLEEGRKYRVVGLRNNRERDCYIHDSGVLPVEVVQSPIIIALPSDKAYEGSEVEFNSINCDKRECQMYRVCNPEGVEEGEKIKITEIIGDLPEKCKEKKDLRLVEIEVL